jgi:hypothetical protein
MKLHFYHKYLFFARKIGLGLYKASPILNLGIDEGEC